MEGYTTRISILADKIGAGVKGIDWYLAKNTLPPPSFGVDAPTDLRLDIEHRDLLATVLDAIQELQELLQGPRDVVSNHHVSAKI